MEFVSTLRRAYRQHLASAPRSDTRPGDPSQLHATAAVRFDKRFAHSGSVDGTDSRAESSLGSRRLLAIERAPCADEASVPERIRSRLPYRDDAAFEIRQRRP